MNFDLYYKAVQADKAWQAALELEYGKDAGDMRYTKAGIATDTLRKLAELKHLADAEWRYYVEQVRLEAVTR